ncbi:MAG: nicotinate-nucleotide adenylyltransferase [Actinomycetota bacterium]|nr:nicotinate-nucleotide adenylyltransferase [Actinomycetota bacterium]
MRTKARLGIMGGTFDPIHFGHLVTAEEALVQFNLDKVVFMPTGQPARKTHQQVTSAEHRYLMTVIATAANPDFEVSRMEIERPGTTYTVDTLKAMRDASGPGTELFFITGADAVWEIVTWKDAEAFAGLCTFIAATRPGYDLDAAREQHAETLQQLRIEFIEVPALAISSTDIRQRRAERRPVRYLLPEPVVAYIEKYRLYREAF